MLDVRDPTHLAEVRAFAARTAVATPSSPWIADAPSSKTAAARRDATSPACAPPIPSAIAKSGGSQT